MATLVDTGILLRAFDANSSDYRAIRRALRKALDEGERLVVTVQNMAEFWNVATRPLAQNGQGLSTQRATHRRSIIERLCEVASEDHRSYAQWKQLVDTLGVSGVAVHDARLISVMLTRQIKQLLTLNERDFRRYEGPEIAVVSPDIFLEKAD